MKSRFSLAVVVLALFIAMSACGKKEPAEETATQPTAQPAATPIDPATAGAIAGMVKLDGPAPKKRKVPMDAEPICVKQHTAPVLDEEVITGAKGELANVVVYVKDGLGNRVFDTPKEPVVLDQKGCLYTPRVLAVQTGQIIRFKNSDPTTHNVHPTPSNNRDWNKSQGPGAADIEDSFAREEVAVPVKCNVHPWMKSWVAVLKHPYFQVTGKDGAFSLKNLPPGEYTVAAWHEKGIAEQKVTIGPKETKTIEFAIKLE
jgi:plastocyanin/predicted small lipoprotein YifL